MPPMSRDREIFGRERERTVLARLIFSSQRRGVAMRGREGRGGSKKEKKREEKKTLKHLSWLWETRRSASLVYCNTQTKPERQSAVVPHRFIFIQAVQLIIATGPRRLYKMHSYTLALGQALVGQAWRGFLMRSVPPTYIVCESTLSPHTRSVNNHRHPLPTAGWITS